MVERSLAAVFFAIIITFSAAVVCVTRNNLHFSKIISLYRRREEGANKNVHDKITDLIFLNPCISLSPCEYEFLDDDHYISILSEQFFNVHVVTPCSPVGIADGTDTTNNIDHMWSLSLDEVLRWLALENSSLRRRHFVTIIGQETTALTLAKYLVDCSSSSAATAWASSVRGAVIIDPPPVSSLRSGTLGCFNVLLRYIKPLTNNGIIMAQESFDFLDSKEWRHFYRNKILHFNSYSSFPGLVKLAEVIDHQNAVSKEDRKDLFVFDDDTFANLVQTICRSIFGAPPTLLYRIAEGFFRERVLVVSSLARSSHLCHMPFGESHVDVSKRYRDHYNNDKSAVESRFDYYSFEGLEEGAGVSGADFWGPESAAEFACLIGAPAPVLVCADPGCGFSTPPPGRDSSVDTVTAIEVVSMSGTTVVDCKPVDMSPEDHSDAGVTGHDTTTTSPNGGKVESTNVKFKTKKKGRRSSGGIAAGTLVAQREWECEAEERRRVQSLFDANTWTEAARIKHAAIASAVMEWCIHLEALPLVSRDQRL